ncbi:MAG: amidohydrolase family protein [bacterium]
MMEVISGLIIPDAETEPYPGKLVIEESKIAALLPAAKTAGEFYICPGFIDSHAHPLETGLGLFFPDLSPAKSINDILELISFTLSHKPDLPLMLAFNLDPDRIKEHRYPYCRELDRLTAGKPVFVYRVDQHSAVANSSALSLLPEPLTDGVELDGAGKPTGVVRGLAYENISALIKRQLPVEVIKEALNLTTRLAAQKGITSLAAFIGSDELDEKEWALFLDILAGMPTRMIPFLQTWKPETAKRFGLPRIGGCLLLDGSFGSHTAALSEDYNDAPGFNGLLYHSDQELVAFIIRSVELELQTAFHAIGDRAIEQLVRCHELIIKKGLGKAIRHRIEHAELLSSELIKRIAELKLNLCVQPSFEAYWGGPTGMYARRLGKRWQKTNPLQTLLKNGVRLAGGSDAPITPLDPLAGIKAATSLPNSSERISGKDAFALFTVNAAYSLGIEQRSGSLKPGLEADLVILDADPRQNPDCHVLATYRAGKAIYQQPQWR